MRYVLKTGPLFSKYYYSQPGFLDGTTEFHEVCRGVAMKGETILEIGPGPANRTSAFLATLGRVVGVDISEEIRDNRQLAEAQVYDGSTLPFKDASFRVCVSDYVLEHVANPQQHFQEICRVLGPGGVYCFRTPNLWHYLTLASKILPHRLHVALANPLRGLSRNHHPPYPTCYAANTRRRITQLSASAGFSKAKLRTIEKEPLYATASRALFFPMMAYERLVNSSDAFAGGRVNILGVLQKDAA